MANEEADASVIEQVSERVLVERMRRISDALPDIESNDLINTLAYMIASTVGFEIPMQDRRRVLRQIGRAMAGPMIDAIEPRIEQLKAIYEQETRQ